MKLDVNVLRYLTKDEFRVLTAVEMGQKNHEIVPIQLIDSISGLKHGGAHKCIKTLLRHKLLHHDSSAYDGYRLTWMGYDFLAIKVLLNRGHISGIGRQIGVGKESDIYEAMDDEGNMFALKLHRLGRTSFRQVKAKRDYLGNRHNYSWLYLSRLAALKEYAFMRALGEHGFPVPVAIDNSRHAVLMSMVDGRTLVQVRKLENPGRAYATCMDLIARFAAKGLVHCDFNEFNLMINEDDEELIVIDFPQMVSVSHANARELFDRDVECIMRFFRKKVGYEPTRDPSLPYIRPSFTAALAAAAEAAATAAAAAAAAAADPDAAAAAAAADEDAPRLGTLDVELAASGFKGKHQRVLEEFQQEGDGHGSDSERDDGYGGQQDDSDCSGDEGDRGEGQDDEASTREQACHAGEGVDEGERTGPGEDRAAAQSGPGGVDVASLMSNATGADSAAGGTGSAAASRVLPASAGHVSAEDDVGPPPRFSSDSSPDSDEDASSSDGWSRRDDGEAGPAGGNRRRNRPVAPTIGEREAQQLVAAQKRAAVKRAMLARAAATRNSSKLTGKGKSRGKGGGAAAVADSLWG